jgi:hypothetical protein
MRAKIAAPIVVALTAVGSQAQASNWSMNGASCTPGDPAIEARRYTITGGSLTHQVNATGLITLYCPIAGTWGSNAPTVIWMTYMDSDPTIASITAQVIRLAASGGSLNMISPVLTNRNTPNKDGIKIGLNFNHTFDFKNSYYYVRVDLNRSSTGGYSKLFGVGLDCPTCPTG